MTNISHSAKLLFVLALTLGFSACTKKDNAYTDDIKYAGAKMVSFNNYDGYQKLNLNLADTFINLEFEVKLSNTTATASSPITVNLIKDDAAVSEYSTLNGTSLTPPPIGSYKIDPAEVVIPRGARTARINVQINTSKFDLSKTTALGLAIASVRGDNATVHSDMNQTRLVAEFGTLNKYDGVYTVTGSFEDVGLGPVATSVLPNEVHLITTSATSVTVYRLINGAYTPGYLFSNGGAGTYYGNWGAIFTFDPATDNLISVTNYYGQGTNAQGRSGAIDPSGAAQGKNKFFPADNSIKAKYFMMQPNATTIRAKFDELYTYVGPR